VRRFRYCTIRQEQNDKETNDAVASRYLAIGRMRLRTQKQNSKSSYNNYNIMYILKF